MEILSSISLSAVILVILAFILLTSAVKVVQEYERGVIFRLGRLMGAKGPGLFFIIPFIDRMMKIDLRVITMDVPAQEVITRDNVTIKVNAVVYFKVVDPNMAVVKVLDYIRATSQIAQTTLRSVLGQSDLDESAGPARPDQRAAAADHRRADGALGRQGERGRSEGRGAAPDDAASHGQAGRGRAREEGQDDPRPGRVRGFGETGGCGRRAEPVGHGAAASLPADPDRDRGGEELHHHLPAAHRPDHGDAAPVGPWQWEDSHRRNTPSDSRSVEVGWDTPQEWWPIAGPPFLPGELSAMNCRRSHVRDF